MTEHIEPESKRELLEIMQGERSRFDAVVGKLTEAQLQEPGIEGGRSVKDILAHITAWEQRMIRWAGEATAGLIPQRPAPGMTWDDLDQLNEQTYLENMDKTLADVLLASASSYAHVLKTVQALTESDLFNGSRFAWRDGDPMWHMVAANTWWHYKEHREQIEAWLEERA